jgi:uncharacterized protein (DUF58 family)
MAGSQTQRTAAERFIDPVVLARIGNLELLARIVVQGFMSGLHRAMYVGASTEFTEHRSYTPGDDVRHVDWKLFGRTDRLYLKTFEAQTNADVVLALDASGSMQYGKEGITKFDYAKFTAASLAWLGRSQRDRVGLAFFDDTVKDFLAPAVGRQSALAHALSSARAHGVGSLEGGLTSLAARLNRRAVVVVVSDFYEPALTVVDALSTLRARGHEVIALQVFDSAERHLGLAGTPVLRDMESGAQLPVVIDSVKDEYQAMLKAHTAALEAGCGARGMDYILADTSMPLDAVLFEYLSGRSRRAKVR